MIISWNLRGLNNVGKLKEISSRLLKLRPTIAILIETRVKNKNAKKIRDKLKLPHNYLDNYKWHDNGRLWIEWDNSKIDVRHVKCSSQYVHVGVYNLQGEFKFWLTAVYALNQLDRRKVLWKDLEAIHKHQQGPWCVIGDFNNVTKAQDRIGGKAVTESEYIDLLNMMETTGLAEMDTTGEFYTWTNKQVIGTIYSRIDRVLGNLDWFQDNLDTVLTVLPASVSDHALLCVSRKDPIIKNNKNFRFSNCLIEMEGYNDMVKASWSRPTRGSPMVRLWNKLKRLQQDMRRFSKPLSNLKQNLIKAREDLQFAQENLRNNNMNGDSIDRVRQLTEEVINLNDLEEKMLMQRAKVDWIRKGDGNNSFFHAIIKSRNNRRNIYMLQKTDGTLLENQSEIEDEIMDFYKKLMGTEDSQLHHIDIDAMRNGKQVNMEQRRYLVSNITEQDIERALKGIGDDKSPGIDGFGAKFFKASWCIVKEDVIAAILEFFNTGRLYRGFNNTVVTLIPKGDNARYVKDYRPIAGCTTVYKIIAKIITERLGKILPSIISHSQAAFVPGQNIHNHILLAYELLNGYGRKGGTPRVMMQLDLHKAYDMVNWRAMECILKEIGLPMQFVSWIMTGVSTVSYRFNVNGTYSDIMQAKRGIRQGDPMSPMLFVIIMEYMHRTLVKMQQNPDFNHHSKCEKIGLTNLTFADDVLLFCRGDSKSVSMMMETIRKFSDSTGLKVNPAKCQMFFGGMDGCSKENLRRITDFAEGKLPVRYLGVPLSCKRLTIQQYMPLIDKIVDRVKHWTSKLLSYAGRIQLVKSITSAIAMYWMQCFPLPQFVLRKINAICRSFVWTGKQEISKKSLVAWDTMCRNKSQGGVGIINLQVWNIVSLMKCLWNICRNSENLWVLWVHTYYLKGNDAITAFVRPNSSWILKNIMNQRDKLGQIQQHWDQALSRQKFPMSAMYHGLTEEHQRVPWRSVMCGNKARPRAVICLWLACHKKLSTKDRLRRFGMIQSSDCSICNCADESINHLFFNCSGTREIWGNILDWLGRRHDPREWDMELAWIIENTKGKGWKSALLKMATAETVYNVWHYRNSMCFGTVVDKQVIERNIIDNIVYRSWQYPTLRSHVAKLMM